MRCRRRVAASGIVLLVGCLAGRAGDWPQWRGPTGQGLSDETGLPLRWGPAENVAWKAEVPGAGWSSPVVRGGRVFVTATADDGASCHVLCYDRRDGKRLWDTEVFRQQPTTRNENNSFATPTPAADGGRVYAVFSGGGIAAVGHDGKVAWVNRDLHFYGVHGCGASPVLWRDLLVFPFDITSDGPNKALGHTEPWSNSYVVAVDTATGKVRWKAGRGLSRVAHVTPLVLPGGGRPGVVSPAGDVVQGFDLKTGERLWSLPSPGEGVVPSPAADGDMLFTASGFGDPTLRAFRLAEDRAGAPEPAWKSKQAVPMIPSLLAVGGRLYTVSENGIAQCLDAATGKPLWRERLGGSFHASPVYAGGRLYLLREDGDTVVLEAGPKFKLLARNPLSEKCRASPAVSGGQLFLRGEHHLYCVGRPERSR